MILSDLVGIIADDLTGANDTALQFHQRGANTKILLDSECTPKVKAGTEVWALSSESRNISKDEAIIKVKKAITKCFLKFLCERNANRTPLSACIKLF